MKSVVTTDRLLPPAPSSAYAVKVDRTILLGAAAGTDRHGVLAGETAEQARQLFGNLEITLGQLGAGLDDVVQMKAWLRDMRDAVPFQRLLAEFFPSGPPSHAVVGSPGFALPHAALEVELVAGLGPTEGAPTYCAAHGVEPFAVFADLAGQLAAANLDPDDVVALDVTLADLRHLASFDAAYEATFAPPFPARTLVVAPLVRPADRVQVEAIAIAGGGRPIGAKRPLSSAAVLAGEELFIAGQLGHGDGAQSQAHAAWAQIKTLLAEAGMTAAHVIRTSNVLTDWRLYRDFSEGYAVHVGAPFPPCSTALGGLADSRAVVQIAARAHRQALTSTVLSSEVTG
jgi:enamine deaminase RidA (YjgF/YER057c/UK114 family)